MSTERDDNSVEHRDEGVAGTAHRPDAETGHPRRPRLVVGAVALAVLLAGAGGAYWAARSGGGDRGGAAHGRPAPLRLDPVGPVPVTGSDGPGSGGAVFQLTGSLPKGPGSAPVYRADAEVTRAQAQRLAGLLGMTGPAVLRGGAWEVGGAPGGSALTVGRSAPGNWTYSGYGPAAVPGQLLDGSGPAAGSVPGSGPAGGGPGSAASGTPGPGPAAGNASSTAVPGAGGSPDAGNAASGTSGPGPAAGGTAASGPADPAPGTGGPSAPVSARRAQEAAAPLLAGLGLSGARIDASPTVGDRRTVTVDPVVGGLPTHGWSTRVEVGPDGRLVQASGRLSALTKGDTYPVVSAKTAFEQLGGAMDAPDHGVANCMVPLVPRVPATPTVPGEDKKLPRSLPHTLPCVAGNGHPTQVRGAVFGLWQQFVSGAEALVPAWLFDVAPAGVTGTAVVAEQAVDPAYVQGGGSATAPAAPGGPVDPGGPMLPGGPTATAVPAQPADPRTSAEIVRLTGYQTDGGSLAVSFVGGVCSTYHAKAEEAGDQVRVSVTAVPIGKPHTACPAMARTYVQKVQLKQPLAGRTVVDTSNGQPVRGQ
ncbi:hypothetical protein [Actinacidiphila sp. ITFR-21]|uniref:hypothetical protein n=1 Tax=Actinacidiphila sp. ITFR-21 TaxID=3075199 RepID=UPI0028899DB0|nr:hypothetical protein [Streptomyces sp. ITFR-21]WNI15190.1 hypothetical protein RLT57_06335 [Streptomyces sp. ITFR-21]